MEEALVEALSCGDGETQILAAKSLCELTSKQRHRWAEKGVISPLVFMLHSQDYDAIKAALFALLSLASGSERNKIRITKSGAVPVLLELLHCQNQSLLELAMAALLILSSCSANKVEIAACGTVQVLVEILNDNNNTTQVMSLQAQLDLIATLHNLSTCHQIFPSIVSSGLADSLVQLIHGSQKSSELVEKATGLLERTVSCSEIALREAASTGGAIQAMVEALEEGSMICKEHAVSILVLICQSCKERYRGLILREGVMPGLLQLRVDGTWRAKDMADTLLLLLRDCSGRGRGSRRKQWENALLEQAMEQIDADERVGTVLRLVEETIAKLST